MKAVRPEEVHDYDKRLKHQLSGPVLLSAVGCLSMPMSLGICALLVDLNDAIAKTDSNPVRRSSNDDEDRGPCFAGGDFAPVVQIYTRWPRIILWMRVPFADVVQCLVGFLPSPKCHALMMGAVSKEAEATLNVAS